MLKTLINSTLNVTDADRVCIICDTSRKKTAFEIKKLLNDSVHIEHVSERIACDQLPAKIKNLLTEDCYNVVIICIEHEQAIWHSKERKQAKYHLKKRLVSVIAPYEFLEENRTKTDLQLIRDLGVFIKEQLKTGSKVSISSNAGTKLEAVIGDNIFIEDGDYSKPETGGDYPSGEVGFGPKESSVNGKVFYDLKVQNLGIVDVGDIILDIEVDKVITVNGNKQDQFNAILEENEVYSYISEISFGVNPHIEVIDNKTNIVEEKKAGTIHFGHGGNAAYGGRTGPHFDCVIDAPTVFVDDKPFMKNGKFNINGMQKELAKQLKEFNLLIDEK